MKSKIKWSAFIFFLVFSFIAGAQNQDSAQNQEKKPTILKQPLSISAIENERLEDGKMKFTLHLEIPKGHFVYASSLKLESLLKGLNNASFDVKPYPVIEFRDKFSNYELKKGLKEKGQIIFNVPYNFDYNSNFTLHYQACTDEFCYLPKQLSFDHGQAALKKETRTEHTENLLGFEIDFAKSSVFIILLFVFLAGILTSFTPCIFPMIPITLALIGSDIRENRWRAFSKTLFYVFGIAFTYSALGMLAASTGALFGQFLSNPWALIGIGLFYFLMAISLLGVFEFNFLSRLENKFKHNKKQGLVGSFVFGLVTGLFASPCVGPVLFGILTYAAQTNSPAFSTLMLFIYALGIGQIFLLISLSGGLVDKLPRSGSWLNYTKWLLAGLLIAAGLYFFIPGVKNLSFSSSSSQETGPNYAQLIKDKKALGRPLIVDLRADWCPACIEMEKISFKDPQVVEEMKNFEFLKIDVTKMSPEKSAILKEYQVLGLPTILVFDRNGQWLKDDSITSYMGPKKLLKLLRKVKSEN